MCDVQHWQVLSKTLIWILWVIWILVWWLVSYIGLNALLVVCWSISFLCENMAWVVWNLPWVKSWTCARTGYLLCSLSGVARAGGTWSMTWSRDEAWEKLRSGDQGHAGRSCEATMEVEATMIREGTGLSYMACTGDVRYWRWHSTCWLRYEVLKTYEVRGLTRKNLRIKFGRWLSPG